MAPRSAPGLLAASRRISISPSVIAALRTADRRIASPTRRARLAPSSASGSRGSWKKNMYQLRASCRRPVRTRSWYLAGCGQFITTSRRVGMLHREAPGDGAAPVVADDDRLVLAERMDEPEHVGA